MDLTSTLGLISVMVLVLANGFFVATEFAIVAVRRSRLEQLARDGHARAQVAQDLVGHLDAYIAACQLGITMASLALGWIGEPALAELVEPWLRGLVGGFAPAAAHGIAIGVAFAIITTLHIVIGELAPKGLALQRPVGTTLWVARPMQLFHRVFRWPITVLNAVGNGVLKLFGLQPAAGHEMVHSAEELQILVTASQRAGTVEPAEARIASRAFEFADLTAGTLMTPRTELEAVPVSTTLDALLPRVASGTHSRLLVYDGSLDNILGAIRVRDLFSVLDQPSTKISLHALLRPVLTVPESKPADNLLEDMRTARQHLAVVIDEYGGTAGIVTLEDLMKGLVGPIGGELSIGSQPPVPAIAEPAPDGSRLLDGLTRLRDFEEITGLHLDDSDHDAADTVNGLIMTRLDRMPLAGDEVIIAGRRLRVEALHGHRVGEVRLLPPDDNQPDQGAA